MSAEQPVPDDLGPAPRSPVRRIRSSPNEGGWRKTFGLFKRNPDEIYVPPAAPSDGRKTIILDMDETLVHASSFPPHPQTDSFKLDDGTYVFKRPGLDSFLGYCKEAFEVFIYTFAEREYAEPVLDRIAPWLDEDHRLYRDSCFIKDGSVFKDLGMLERDMKHLILVEDNKKAMKFYPKNTLVVLPWMGTPNDKELTTWVPEVLEMCHSASDVQKVIPKINPDKIRQVYM